MAEALAVIGLVGNILAFVDFAQKVVTRLNDFSNDLKDTPKCLRQIQTELPLIINGIRRIKARADSGKLDDDAKAALEPVISECQKQTQRLSDILDSILPASNASSWERKKKAMQSLAADRKVEEISEALRRYVHTLTFYHVIEGASPEPVVKSAFWLVPFDRNPSFVGRTAVFDQIDRALQVGEGSQPKVALHGLGGIGKSQIALEYCFRSRQQQPTSSIFWVNAATVARFEESFQNIAKACGLSRQDQAQEDTIELVQRWLEAEHLDPWIMVVDNVDDETAFFREKCRNGKNPSQCLPCCSAGRLLFTSRTMDVAIDLASPATPINIDSMTAEEGLELMRKRLGPGPSEEHLTELLSELEYIPLAVTQCIAFMLKRKKSVQQYLELYRLGDTAKFRLLSHEFLDHGRQEKTMESVTKTWSLSFEWIRKQQPKAADMLCLMSFYQPNSIPPQLLRSEGDDIFEFEDNIAILRAFSLLNMNEPGTSYNTHRLIQAATKWWLGQEEPAQLEQWALRALELIASQFPVDEIEVTYWDDCQSLLPHSELLLQHSFEIAKRESDLVKSKLLRSTGYYIDWMGDRSEMQRRYQQSLEIRKTYLGLEHIDTLESMRDVFWYECRHGSVSEKMALLSMGYEHLERHHKVLGPRHMYSIGVLSNLADLLSQTGDLEKSEVLQREALSLSEEEYGIRHIDTSSCMSGLAAVLAGMERFAEAIEMQTQAVTIQTQLLGPEHKIVLVSKNNLALFLERDGRSDEAVEMWRDVHSLDKKMFGANHPNTLITVRNLAIMLHNMEKYEEAVRVLDNALSSIRITRQRNPGWGITEQELESLKLVYEQELSDGTWAVSQVLS